MFKVKSTVGNKGYRQWYIEDPNGDEYVVSDMLGNEKVYFDNEEDALSLCEYLNS